MIVRLQKRLPYRKTEVVVCYSVDNVSTDSTVFSPLTGRYIINLLKSTDISALVGKVQALSDLRNRNSEIGKDRYRIIAFAFVNVFHQRLVCVPLELTA